MKCPWCSAPYSEMGWLRQHVNSAHYEKRFLLEQALWTRFQKSQDKWIEPPVQYEEARKSVSQEQLVTLRQKQVAERQFICLCCGKTSSFVNIREHLESKILEAESNFMTQYQAKNQ